MATSKLNPYINFNGNTKDAAEFYKAVFGGELTISTYGEGGMTKNPAEQDKIMHAQLIAPNGITIMAADTPEGWTRPADSNISISLSGDGESELKGYWDKLIEGGKIDQSLMKAPWGDTFGMLTDKFGIRWMVNIAGPKA